MTYPVIECPFCGSRPEYEDISLSLTNRFGKLHCRPCDKRHITVAVYGYGPDSCAFIWSQRFPVDAKIPLARVIAVIARRSIAFPFLTAYIAGAAIGWGLHNIIAQAVK